MLKRRVQNKSLTEKYEEITSSKNWIVPSGCTSVDAFVVAGGKDGGSSGPYNGGLGGNGGEVVYELNIPVTPGQSIPVTVGKANENSSFLSLSATSGYGARGGYVAQGDGYDPSNGGDGYDGTYLFGTTLLNTLIDMVQVEVQDVILEGGIKDIFMEVQEVSQEEVKEPVMMIQKEFIMVREEEMLPSMELEVEEHQKLQE